MLVCVFGDLVDVSVWSFYEISGEIGGKKYLFRRTLPFGGLRNESENCIFITSATKTQTTPHISHLIISSTLKSKREMGPLVVIKS